MVDLNNLVTCSAIVCRVSNSWLKVLNFSKCQDKKQSVLEAWLHTRDSNGHQVSEWYKKGKNEYHGYCCFCHIDINCDNGGKVQLLKHAVQIRSIKKQ